jgi:hypothetical protein
VVLFPVHQDGNAAFAFFSAVEQAIVADGFYVFSHANSVASQCLIFHQEGLMKVPFGCIFEKCNFHFWGFTMKVIGIGGQLGSGKDTLADYLAKRLNTRTQDDWARIGFAHAVKKVYMDTFNKNWDFVEEWKRKDEVPAGMNMNVRKSLQFIGDGFRQIQSDIWIETAFRDQKPKVISDVRYINEAKYLKEKQGVSILVWRPGFENNDPNKSESEIRPVVDWFRDQNVEGWGWSAHMTTRNLHPAASLFDIFIRNEGRVEDLYRKVDEIIIPYVEHCFYGAKRSELEDLAMQDLKW